MAEEGKAIKGWLIVAMVFAGLYTFLGLLSLMMRDAGAAPLYLALLPIGLVCWGGVVLVLDGKYSAARVVMWIAGILTFPLGLIMIRAGNRIKRAADRRRNEPRRPR